MYRKPFLKWAGNKYGILDKIMAELPVGSRFVEPFVGSGSVYLNVAAANALICDANEDLIHLFQYIQQEGKKFINYCQKLFVPKNNTKERYLGLRDEYNVCDDPRKRGALFLYLNRHSFNGLMRYNSKGNFNVAFGKYASPYFPLKELYDFYKRTQEGSTRFVCCDFRSTFAHLKKGDVVYCDPPYVPLSDTANFTTYTGIEFNLQDHQRLAKLSRQARRKKIPVVISNHALDITHEIYSSAEIKVFSVRRSISCKATKRTPVLELLAIYR